MICSRVSAGLRGNGLRAALGTSTAKVEASGERDGASGVGLEPGGLGSGSFPEKRRREERSPHPNSRRRPALPGRGGGMAALCSPLAYVPLRTCRSGLWQVFPAWFPFPCFPSPPRPFPNLLGNPSVSISAVTVTHTRGQAVPVKLFLQLASPQSPLLFPAIAFWGYGLGFGCRTPGKPCEQKSRGDLKRVTLPATLFSFHIWRKVASSSPLVFRTASQGPAGQSAPGTAATAVSTSHLGFVPRKRSPVCRRNPVEVKSALSIR